MRVEEWKSIKGYEGYYEISNFGRVKSCTRKIIRSNGCETVVGGIILKSAKNSNNYSIVSLWKDNKGVTKTVHRLVANAFLEKLQINHIDGNKENNDVNNLEWATAKSNQQHAFNVLKRKPSGCAALNQKKSVTMYTTTNEYMHTFNSISEAMNYIKDNSHYNPNRTEIIKVCRGERKTAYGFIWKYNIKENVDG